MPRPKIKPKTYKLDAADLIFLAVQKLLRKRFQELKPDGFENNAGNYKLLRPKNMRKMSFNDTKIEKKPELFVLNKGKIYSSFYKTSTNHELACAQFVKIIKILRIKKKKIFFKDFWLALSKTQEKNYLANIEKFVLVKLKTYFYLIINHNPMRLDLSKLSSNSKKSLRFLTPKPNETFINSYKKASKNVTSVTPNKIIANSSFISANFLNATPGTIIKNIYTKIEDSTNLEEERNPTFGNEEEEVFSYNEINTQNEKRNKEIKQQIEELEKSNFMHKKLVNKAKQEFLGLSKNNYRKSSLENSKESIFSQNTENSLKSQGPFNIVSNKSMFKADISPIKVQHKFNYSEVVNETEEPWVIIQNEPTEQYEDFSLKSFNQLNNCSSFDKESSKFCKEDSFDLKFENLAKGVESNRYCIQETVSPRFKKEEILNLKKIPENLKKNADKNKQKRNTFILRLEGLSRLEEKFVERVYKYFRTFVNSMKSDDIENGFNKIKALVKKNTKLAYFSLKTYKPTKEIFHALNVFDAIHKSFRKNKTRQILKN